MVNKKSWRPYLLAFILLLMVFIVPLLTLLVSKGRIAITDHAQTPDTSTCTDCTIIGYLPIIRRGEKAGANTTQWTDLTLTNPNDSDVNFDITIYAASDASKITIISGTLKPYGQFISSENSSWQDLAKTYPKAKLSWGEIKASKPISGGFVQQIVKGNSLIGSNNTTLNTVKPEKSDLTNSLILNTKAQSGCIITISGKKYNVAPLQSSHDGGNIFSCGSDMTGSYEGQHGSDLSHMNQYLVTSPTQQPTGTATPIVDIPTPDGLEQRNWENLVTKTDTTLFLPFMARGELSIKTGSTQWTEMFIVNPGSTKASLTITAYNTSGASVGTISPKIEPKGFFDSTGSTLWSSNTKMVGWVIIESDVPILGSSQKTIREGETATDSITSAEDSLLVPKALTFGDSSSNPKMHIPLLLRNWTTAVPDSTLTQWSELTLSNPNAEAVDVRIDVHSYQGSASPLKSLNFSIPAKGVYDTYGNQEIIDLLNVEGTGELLAWGIITAKAPITGEVSWYLRNGSEYNSSANYVSTKIMMPHLAKNLQAPIIVRQQPSRTTGYTQWNDIMLVNPNGNSAAITIDVYAADKKLHSFSATIEPFGWYNTYGKQDWLDLPLADSTGWATVTSSEPIHGLYRWRLLQGDTFKGAVIGMDDTAMTTFKAGDGIVTTDVPTDVPTDKPTDKPTSKPKNALNKFDLNADGRLGSADYDILVADYKKAVESRGVDINIRSDFNGDRKITPTDINLFNKAWEKYLQDNT